MCSWGLTTSSRSSASALVQMSASVSPPVEHQWMASSPTSSTVRFSDVLYSEMKQSETSLHARNKPLAQIQVG